MEEVWKVVDEFPNYSVSTYGRIMANKTGKIKKTQNDKDGYNTVTLWENGKSHFRRVCRLVAIAFIPNPNNYPVVNHKDEIKSRDYVDNLEWCTVGYNNEYSKCRPVIQLSTDGVFVAEYKSIQEAADNLGIANTHIFDCCANKSHNKTYKGYQWLYKENYNSSIDYSIEIPMKNRKKKVLQFDLNNNLIKEHEYLSKVEGYTRCQKSTISKCCRGILDSAFGYIWRYAN